MFRVCRYGVTIELPFDQGKNFESDIFKEMYELYGIKARTTPLQTQSDGMIDQFNRTLEEYLRKVVSEQQKDCDEHIPRFLLAYRAAVHDSTSRSSAKVIFGTEIKLPGDVDDVEFCVKPPTGKEGSLNELQELP